MEKYVITIARQFGSLGRPIARELAERLGIEYYDRDIVDAVSKKIGIDVSDVSEHEEKAKHSYLYMKFPLGKGTTEIQNKIFETESALINEYADHESCIIVGRCSDYILENRKNSLHIFIYAPYEARVRNCVDYLKMNMEDAKKRIAEVDKARDAYHNSYAHFLPADINHKNVMIDSSILGIQGTAKVLEQIVREKFDL